MQRPFADHLHSLYIMTQVAVKWIAPPLSIRSCAAGVLCALHFQLARPAQRCTVQFYLQRCPHARMLPDASHIPSRRRCARRDAACVAEWYQHQLRRHRCWVGLPLHARSRAHHAAAAIEHDTQRQHGERDPWVGRSAVCLLLDCQQRRKRSHRAQLAQLLLHGQLRLLLARRRAQRACRSTGYARADQCL